MRAGHPRPEVVSLGKVLDEDIRAAELSRRPWLGRYLAATQAMRRTSALALDSLQISGFNATLSTELSGRPALTDAYSPIILWNEESGFLFDPRRSRLFELSLAAARLIEILVNLGTVGAREIVGDQLVTRGETLLAGYGLFISTEDPIATETISSAPERVGP